MDLPIRSRFFVGLRHHKVKHLRISTLVLGAMIQLHREERRRAVQTSESINTIDSFGSLTHLDIENDGAIEYEGLNAHFVRDTPC